MRFITKGTRLDIKVTCQCDQNCLNTFHQQFLVPVDLDPVVSVLVTLGYLVQVFVYDPKHSLYHIPMCAQQCPLSLDLQRILLGLDLVLTWGKLGVMYTDKGCVRGT